MLLFCVVLPLRAPIMRLFVGADESAVALGASYLFLMAFFYLLPAYTNGLQGYFRGLGDMKITLAARSRRYRCALCSCICWCPAWGLQPWRGQPCGMALYAAAGGAVPAQHARAGRGMNGTGFSASMR